MDTSATLCLPTTCVLAIVISTLFSGRSWVDSCGCSCLSTRRFLSLEVPLVVFGGPHFLEPINELHKWSVVLVVEVVAPRSDLDKLLDHFLPRHVSQDNMLRVLRQYSQTVWNTALVSCFLLAKRLF